MRVNSNVSHHGDAAAWSETYGASRSVLGLHLLLREGQSSRAGRSGYSTILLCVGTDRTPDDPQSRGSRIRGTHCWSSAVTSRSAARRSTSTTRMKTASPGPRASEATSSTHGFTTISIPKYVRLHAKSNPGANTRELAQLLQELLEAKRAGAVCECGEPIWVIGSAQVGRSCFTCITGEAMPDNDYEVVVDNDG